MCVPIYIFGRCDTFFHEKCYECYAIWGSPRKSFEFQTSTNNKMEVTHIYEVRET